MGWSEEGRVGAAWWCGTRGGKTSTVDIHTRVLFLPLGPPVLEPDLDLGLCKVE